MNELIKYLQLLANAFTMDELVNYFQLIANTLALAIAGWLYAAYIKNLNSIVLLKDAEIVLVEKNKKFFEERVESLEKRSPENIEKILNDRIKIREDELERLREDIEKLSESNGRNQNGKRKVGDEEIEQLRKDKEDHQKELSIKEQELARLRIEIEKTKDTRRTIDWLEDEVIPLDSKYEIEEIGFVAVDTGKLMITDPGYIDSMWEQREFEDLRLYRDIDTSIIYQFRKDFKNYREKIDGFDKTVKELIQSGKFEKIAVDFSDKIDYSYAGASYAALSESGYGSMPFKLGHEGAGIAVRTVSGDGLYPVYAEKYEGEIIRVYFNLL